MPGLFRPSPSWGGRAQANPRPVEGGSVATAVDGLVEDAERDPRQGPVVEADVKPVDSLDVDLALDSEDDLGAPVSALEFKGERGADDLAARGRFVFYRGGVLAGELS